jgi:hypothetical protein
LTLGFDSMSQSPTPRPSPLDNNPAGSNPPSGDQGQAGRQLNRRQRVRAYLECGIHHRESKKKRKASDEPVTLSDDEEGQFTPLPDPASVEGQQSVQDPEFTAEQLAEKYLVLDRITRWHAFLYASNLFFTEIISEVFGKISAEGTIRRDAKDSIFDNIKAYKGQVLSNMEVRIDILDASCLMVETSF